MEIDLAIRFVNKNGGELQRARLDHILHRTPAPPGVIVRLLKFQLQDGSFTQPRPSSLVGSINETLNALWRMEELGLMKSVAAEQACHFLVSRQGKNGSWQEEPGSATPLQSYTQDPLFSYYLSAYAAYFLALFGFGSAPVLEKAARYLAGIQKPAGNFEGFLHTTWLACSALLLINGPRDKRAKKSLLFLKNLDFEDWESSQIAWALSCLGNAGITAKHPFISAGLTALEENQLEDGSWLSEDGAGYEVEATIAAIKAWKFFRGGETG